MILIGPFGLCNMCKCALPGFNRQMFKVFSLLVNFPCNRTFSTSKIKSIKTNLKPLPILNATIQPTSSSPSVFGNDFQRVMNFLNRVSSVLGVTIPRPEIIETTKNTSHKMYEVLAHNNLVIPEKFKYIFRDEHVKFLDSLTFFGRAKTITEARQKALFNLADCLYSSLKLAESFLPTIDQDPKTVLPFINFNLTERQLDGLKDLLKEYSEAEASEETLNETELESKLKFNPNNVQKQMRVVCEDNNAKRPELLHGKLPIYRHYKEIVKSIEENQVTIVSATTGSGKTTQIPKFILHHFQVERPSIIVTQPRRVAAISLANRLANELGENHVGQTVGYSVRFDSVLPSSPKSNICT